MRTNLSFASFFAAATMLLASSIGLAQTYNSYSGFSSTTQGANQWYYLDGNNSQMSWGTTYVGGAWASTDWCFISADKQHPGTASTTLDSVRRWVAPKAGTVDIVGASMMSGTYGGDGAEVVIRRNGSSLFRGFVSPSDTSTGQRWVLSTRVDAGDNIDTVITKGPAGSTYNGDQQVIDQTISYNSSLPSVPYNSVAGFSLSQSTNEWRYLDEALSPSVMASGTAYAGAYWYSNSPIAGGDWCYLAANYQHPGTGSIRNDSVRRWVAPSTGTVVVSGSSRMSGYNGGDGVNIYIKKNGAIIDTEAVAASDIVGVKWGVTTTVSTNDTIDTVLNRGNSNSYNGDEQIIDQTITYEPQAIVPPGSSGYGLRVSSFDFSGGEVDAIKTVNSSLTQISSSVTSSRLVRADSTPVFRAFVSTSSTTTSDWPKRLKIEGTAKVICEALRSSGSTMPSYSETSNSIASDFTAANSMATVGNMLVFNPASYSCPSGELLRRIEVEIYAVAYKSDGTTIATTPSAKFVMLKRLKVMTFNVEGGKHNLPTLSGTTTINAIGDLIAAEKVDFVALQEVHQNFTPTYIDDMSLLRTKLNNAGINYDLYTVGCDVGSGSSGTALFSRFQFHSPVWSYFDSAYTKCAGGANYYWQAFGRQTVKVTVGAANLAFGHTHFHTTMPSSYSNWDLASQDFGTATNSAMNSSTSSFVMMGDLNCGPGSTCYAGYAATPSTVMTVTSTNTYAINLPSSYGASPNDQMLWKTSADVQIIPESTYTRSYSGTNLSDHEPRVTTFLIR